MVEPGLGLRSDYEHIGHIYSYIVLPFFRPLDIRGYSRKLFRVVAYEGDCQVQCIHDNWSKARQR